MSTETAVKETKQYQQLIQIDPGVTVPGFGNQKSFELLMRGAKVLASSTLVPKHYQNELPNCIIALNMAGRTGADPLMVMQNLYIVHGSPSFSSQFLISAFNTSGRFSALRYDWTGEQGSDKWGCRAWAIEKSTGERLEGSIITIDMAKKEGWYGKNGSKWHTMPQQMLMYRAAAFFIRTYAPELTMGMHTMEEMEDITPRSQVDPEATIKQNANRQVIDVEPVEEEVEETQPAAETEKKAEPAKKEPEPAPVQAEIEEDPGF